VDLDCPKNIIGPGQAAVSDDQFSHVSTVGTWVHRGKS
jgi:hypothetical protein